MGLKHKKRILITIDWFLPGYKAGGPIQSCANLIAHLKDEFDFYVMTRNTDYTSEEPYPGIPANTWYHLEEGVQVYYFSADKLSYTSLKEVIRKLHFNVIYINGIFSKYFSLFPLLIARKHLHVPVVVAARGMFAPGAVNVKPGKKKAFFYVAKRLKLYANTTFHATNLLEKAHIESVLGKQVKVAVAANLPKALNKNETAAVIQKESGFLKLVSIARISPEKNTRYALEILKRFTYEGDIIFDIYGPVNDAVYWKECQAIIQLLPANIKVNYKGSLPSGMVPETLVQYHALFLPTRGENFGHIILESLTAGLPVILSDQTPWRGLEAAQVGWDIPLQDEDKFREVLAHCVRMENEEYQHMRHRTQLYLKEKVITAEIIQQNRQLFNV